MKKGPMTITSLIMLAISPICGIDNVGASYDEGTTMTAEIPTKVNYRDYLNEVGKKLNCYFTIERLANTLDRRSPLDRGLITPGDVATIDALIAKLNAEKAGVTASQDKLIPWVIHLTENALHETKGYDLDKKVSFKFRGAPFQMLDGLNQFYPTVGPSYGWSIPQDPRDYQDFSTEVEVDIRDVPLRQVLTSAVSPPRFHRIMWDASTSTIDQDKGTYTSIVYNGRWDTNIPPPAPPARGYFIGPNNGVLKIDFDRYLREVSERLDCYFTIEASHNRPLQRAELLIDPTDDGTIDAVIAKLNKEVRRFKAVRDEARPSVIHLTNVSLTEAGLNVLDRKVTLSYRGTIGGLLDRLNQIDPIIGNAVRVDNRGEGVTVEDNSEAVKALPVAVEARDLPIRQVLTSAVSLPGYHAIIWRAHTKLEEGKLFTGVSFSGPKPPKK